MNMLKKRSFIKNRRFLSVLRKAKLFRHFKNFPLGNRRALSPLVATVLLVVFALVIGTITMNWGKSYVDKLSEKPEVEEKIGSFDSAIIISIKDVDTDMKRLMVKHLTGEITEEEFRNQAKS